MIALNRWASRVGVGLLVLASADVAAAQGASSARGGRTRASTSRTSASADVPVSDTARRHFSQGVRYLSSQDPGRYEKAYREFKAAYADSPSWKILGNLGIAAHELERDGEAIDAFEAYLERGGKELSVEERKQFAEDLEVLRAGHATVKIKTLPPGAWILDERLPDTGSPIVNRYGPTGDGELVLRVRAGHHRIRAELNGYESEAWDFSQAPGQTLLHDFVLRAEAPPEPEPATIPVEAPRDARSDAPSSRSSALRVGSYVAAGLGAVGLGLGTWFFLDGRDKQRTADGLFADCEAATVAGTCGAGNPLEPDARDAQEAEHAAFTRAGISYVAGGALLATGVVLFILSSSGDAEAEVAEASITPWVGPSQLGVSGTF